jgi:hypothetical protein
VAADLLNDRMIPFLDEHGVMLQRLLTDRGLSIAVRRNVTNTNCT